MDKSIKIRNRIVNTVGDVFAQAEVYKLSHAKILENMIKRVYDDPQYQNLARPYWAYIRGVIDTRFGILWRSMEWRVCLDGKYISDGDVPKGRWSEVEGGASFWRGTEKRYR